MRHIETVICENCGKEFEARAKNAKYCCRRCANQRNNARRGEETFQCPHNQYVTCSQKACGACGWNPRVAKERMARFLGKECTA